MASVAVGLVGGLLATVGMTLVMMVMGDGGPPPTASLVAKFRENSPEDNALSRSVSASYTASFS